MARGKYKDWLTKDGLLKLEGWARDGLTDEQIANNIGIAPRTLYRWKDKYSQISQSLKKGKEVVDREVENSLLKRALGYKETIQKTKVLSDGTVIPYEEEVYYPPDTTAQIFWLTNRKSDNWKRNANKERLDEKKFEHDKDIDNKKYW